MNKWLDAFMVVGFTCLGCLSPLQAQEDVCCVMAKKQDTAAVTISTVRSSLECRAGGNIEDYHVCSAMRDPENNCPNLTDKERCLTCGFFWTGQSCLQEDPVKKARAELEEEAKNKPVQSQEPINKELNE